MLSNTTLKTEESLKKLTENINAAYYDLIKLLCKQIGEHIEHLKKQRLPGECTAYLNLCDKLVEKVSLYINLRKQIFVPYIDKLAEKDASSHDCKNCSGKCSLEHGSNLENFKMTLQNIKQTLYDIRVAVLQEYNVHNKELRFTHNLVMQLDEILHELFYVEEEHLLPRIKDAQMNIHAS